MELKELFKIAGVDTTKGKAKKLCESTTTSTPSIIRYINDWIEASQDPDFSFVDKRKIFDDVQQRFGTHITPQQSKLIANYIHLWTSSGDTEESPPSENEVSRWVSSNF